MQNAIQLSQDEALRKLVELRVIENVQPPPQRAIQVVACHGVESSYMFAMTRDPLLPGFDALDAWELTGPLELRKIVAGTIQSLISKRHPQQ